MRFFGGGSRTSTLFMSLSRKLIRFVDTIHRDQVTTPVRFLCPAFGGTGLEKRLLIKPDRWIRAWAEGGGVEPYDPAQVNAASYDVRVSDHWICPTREPEEFRGAADEALPRRGGARLDPRVRAHPARPSPAT